MNTRDPSKTSSMLSHHISNDQAENLGSRFFKIKTAFYATNNGDI